MINSCADCPVPEELGCDSEKRPASVCYTYPCDVATTPGPSDYLLYLIDMLKLRNAGFPFTPEDLTIQAWIDLSAVHEFFDVRRKRDEMDRLTGALASVVRKKQ